jgi:hypothetical protein
VADAPEGGVEVAGWAGVGVAWVVLEAFRVELGERADEGRDADALASPAPPAALRPAAPATAAAVSDAPADPFSPVAETSAYGDSAAHELLALSRAPPPPCVDAAMSPRVVTPTRHSPRVGRDLSEVDRSLAMLSSTPE